MISKYDKERVQGTDSATTTVVLASLRVVLLKDTVVEVASVEVDADVPAFSLVEEGSVEVGVVCAVVVEVGGSVV